MQIKSSQMCLVFLSIVLAGAAASAKTIALWPLGGKPTASADGTCVTDERFNLGFKSVAVEDSTPGGWNLPPNPVPETELIRPAVARSCVAGTAADQSVNQGIVYCSNGNLAKFLYPTNDFTVEGWMRFDEFNHSASSWRIVMQAGGSTSSNGGWALSLRNGNDGKGYYLDLYSQNLNQVAPKTTGDKTCYKFIDGSRDVTDDDILDKWHHYAVAFEYESRKTSGKSRWLVYFDGRCCFTLEWDRIPVDALTGTGVGLDIGGRTASNLQRVKGAVSYWRVSDTALEAKDLLNYGTGTVVPVVDPMATSTVAYWPLTVRNGQLDARDHVGIANLSDSWQNSRSDYPVAASSDAAFGGTTPLNANTTLSTANSGSFFLQCQGAYLVATNLVDAQGNPCLDYDHAFTVEGWIKPMKHVNDDNIHYVFGTRTSANQREWTLMFKHVSYYWNFYLIGEDGGTDKLIDGDSTLLSSNDDCLNEWGSTWKHIALTYSPNGGPNGRGLWKLYLDGRLTGTHENRRVPGAAKKKTILYLAGADNSTMRSFPCLLDCWRVCGAALEPNQFLNAKGGAAATDVIALWPLDQMDGVALDGHDEIAGGASNNLFARTKNYYSEGNAIIHAVPSEVSHELLTNPDRSASFSGSSDYNVGSASFSFDARRSLVGSAPNVSSTLGNTGAWTLEGFIRKTGNVGTAGTFGMIMGAFDNLNGSSIAQWSLCCQKSTERIIYRYDHGGSGVERVLADEPLELNRWYHFAWECAHDCDAKTGTMRFYLDGALQKEIALSETDVLYMTSAKTLSVGFGGLRQNYRNFPGHLNHLRLSNRLLEPSEFLNAMAPTPTPAVKGTLAYWPLGNAAGEKELTSLCGPSGYDLYNSADAVGCADAASPTVVAYTPKTANAGSITIPAGKAAQNPAIGLRMETYDSWTIDGWVRPAEDTQSGVLFGTMNASLVGFQLSVDLGSGAPRFHLCYRNGKSYSPYVDADFIQKTSRRFAMSAGKWTHLALVHDATNRDEEWTLYVNGRHYGSLSSVWHDLSTLSIAPFAFGDRASSSVGTFAGDYDLWRVSAGALDRLELNYDNFFPGLLMIVK